MLTFLAFATMHNGVMHVPYMTRFANGWPDFAVRVNTVAVAFIVPAILWAGPRFGGIGGAGTWFALKPTHVPYRCPFHAPQNLSPREMAMASRCCFPAALPTDSPAHGCRFSQLSPTAGDRCSDADRPSFTDIVSTEDEKSQRHAT